ncbi:hypothetical protein AAFF_G00264670 [Aldrovandia affinis]|uniref:Uncharacterized protein n=1 Tax=Aldrovandia affinis TaxID=143900 RepID=A0AAD7W1Z2_9TELE|nr:hypothetical protein AAFF_G00264670 [Aldrovandia affinis]
MRLREKIRGDCVDPLVAPLDSSSFLASSRYSVQTSADFAKLYGSSGWSPSLRDAQPWLQIDLRRTSRLVAISTQGSHSSPDWVSRYMLLYGDRPDSWAPYTQRGGNSSLSGNWNNHQVKRHDFHHAFTAKHLRFLPLAWNSESGGKIGVRLELYGCAYDSYVMPYSGDDVMSYLFPHGTSRTLRDDMALSFRTLERDGVLLHSRGAQGDLLTVELRNGRIHLHISLGGKSSDVEFRVELLYVFMSPATLAGPCECRRSHSGGLFPRERATHATQGCTSLSAGSLLDDQRWHHVAIERRGRQVNLTVDGHAQAAVCDGAFTHLDLDTQVYVGGVIEPNGPRLPGRSNFRGCLENVLYNGMNLVAMAQREDQRIRLRRPQGTVGYVCQDVPLNPLSLAGPHSYLQLRGVSHRPRLAVRLTFRSWDGAGLLMFTSFADGLGALELGLSDGQITFSLTQPARNNLQFTAGHGLSDGSWHTVQLAAGDNSVTVEIDDDETPPLKITNPVAVLTGDRYFFGGCPQTSDPPQCETQLKAFRGCMQQISVDGEPADIDAALQQHGGGSSGLLLGACSITDRPSALSPLLPCEMTATRGWTVVSHNRMDVTKVTGSSMGQPFLGDVQYRSASWDEVTALARTSGHCEQWVEYSCHKSRLLNSPSGTPFGYWVGRHDERQVYWGGSFPGIQKCGCGINQTCTDPRFYCNCDADHDQWYSDRGWLTFRDHLPVRRIVVGDTNRTGSEAQFRLGPLRCHGDRSVWNTVTFTAPTHIQFPTFTPGGASADISFHFKTTADHGVFLENSDQLHHNFIRVELNSTTLLLFVFAVGDGLANVTFRSPTALNDDRWHRVRAEINVKAARLSVDTGPWVVRRFPEQTYITMEFTQPLLVGAAEHKVRAYLGCLRGLRMNGEALDLGGKVNVREGVRPDCAGRCVNPAPMCRNGGRCVEGYASYSCDCNNTAFEGLYCHKDIGAYFEAGSWLRYDIQREPITDEALWAGGAHGHNETGGEEIEFSFSSARAPPCCSASAPSPRTTSP